MKNYIYQIFKFFDYSKAFVFYKNKISKLLNININDVDKVYRELQNSDFTKEVAEKARIKEGFGDFSMLSVLRAPTIYALCRLVKPQIIVETGVCSGFSSAFILYALNRNNKGSLFSIDLPNQPGHEIPDAKPVGWVIPKELRGKWQLILGSSQQKLPPLLKRLKEINIFYHDSDHSYNNMIFEFNACWDFLKEEGLLLSDDITDNKAFDYFCNEKKCANIKLFKLGIVKKH